MAELFRSAEMSYLQVIMPEEYAHSFAHYLAVDGCAQITDVYFSIFFIFYILVEFRSWHVST